MNYINVSARKYNNYLKKKLTTATKNLILEILNGNECDKVIKMIQYKKVITKTYFEIILF